MLCTVRSKPNNAAATCLHIPSARQNKRTRQLLKPQASSGGASVCVLKRKLSFGTGHLMIHRLSESVDFIHCINTVVYDKRDVLRHILHWF